MGLTVVAHRRTQWGLNGDGGQAFSLRMSVDTNDIEPASTRRPTLDYEEYPLSWAARYSAIQGTARRVLTSPIGE